METTMIIYEKYLQTEGIFKKAKDSYIKKRDEKKAHKFLLKHGWNKFLSSYYLYKEYGDVPFGRDEAVKKVEYYLKTGAYTW